MANHRPQVFNLTEQARFDELPLTNIPLFREEEFSGCVLALLPGQVLPFHSHEHVHEVFDVLEGTGTIWLDNEAIKTQPGISSFVPAGTEHGFDNDSDERWLLRATIYERTYLGTALKRAILKRLGKAAR